MPSSTPEFLALLHAAPDAMVIIDRDGVIVTANRQAAILFGYELQELEGAAVETLIPRRFRERHPAHRKRYFDEPHPRPMGAQGSALFGLRKDGREFPAEVSLSPIEVSGQRWVIAAIRDGTRRRQTEDYVRAVLEAAPDAMVITNADGVITLVNEQTESMFGYGRDQLLGRPVEILIPERYRRAHPGHRQRYFSEAKKRPMGGGGLALFGLRADGTEFPVEISLSPLMTESGLHAIAAIRDASDRIKADEERTKLVQAQEALRLRDEFLAIASHELKTPLTALHMQLAAIEKHADKLGDERLTKKAAGTLRAVDRLHRLVLQLLDLSRIAAGRLKLETETVDLGNLLRDITAQFRDEAMRAGCDLRLRLDETIIGEWDPLRLEQIVANLVSNAIKYGPGKPIEVTAATTSGGDVTITVRDHGIGIPIELQERIFERFERAVSERNYGGFGLGLWIARRIVEAHGGTIRVWSQTGAGATFTVDLPRGRPVVAEEPTPSRSIDANRILVVDDDADIREAFAEALADEGFVVDLAANGAEALQLLRTGRRPALILLDLMMPIMDGSAMLAELRKDPALDSVPVVLTSAASDLDRYASALGIADCLRKPVKYETLIATAARYRQSATATTP
jgi:PAS domain S-box-containing protein